MASGQDIKDIVEGFKDRLPVEYYRSEPGQIRQRNVGISKLDERTKLVASMDDDVTYHEDAVAEMIRFWNTVPSDTAGVGFNVITLSVIKHNWFRGFIGFSSAIPGQVLKSGFNTSINNVEENIKVGISLGNLYPNNANLLFFHGNGEIVQDYDEISKFYSSIGIN